METLLQVIEQKNNYTSNLGLKFWWWALETIISHGQPATRGPHATLEALKCGPSTDFEKRYFGAKSIQKKFIFWTSNSDFLKMWPSS
jgi:hypothetical protein